MVSIPHPPLEAGASRRVLVLGLDIGGTKLAAGVVRAGGELLSLVRAPTPDPTGPWQAGVSELIRLGRHAIHVADVEVDDLAAIGIGSGGPLDSANGIVMRPPNLHGWDDVPVVRLLEAEFGRPVFLENDANAGVLASHRWGAWAGTPNLVYITISTGIGGGIVIDGRLLRGATGNGGEIGHTMISWGGRPCDCGQRGCVEAYASGTSIARRAAEAVRGGRGSSLASLRSVTAADVAAAAAHGDPLAAEIWDETTAILGSVVTSVVNLFEPNAVILGGGVTEAGDQLLEPVRTAARAIGMSRAGRTTAVAITEHGRAIGVLGSAAVAFDRLGIGAMAR